MLGALETNTICLFLQQGACWRMGKVQLVLEIVALLQGTPLDAFARENLWAQGDKVVVKCAERATLATAEGIACKRGIATALRLYSYRLTGEQLAVLGDLYVSALNRLEPEALVRVRQHMCDASSEQARRDADAAAAVCDWLSLDY
jgi:hypothetical protein